MQSTNIVLSICYDSKSDNIKIEGRHIRHLQTRGEYVNPVSDVPDRQDTAELLDAELTEKQLEDLSQFIQSSGFETLNDTYGAPEGDRFYPYRLTIKLGDRLKDVLYRSNPSFEEPPAIIRAIERYLLELSEKVRQSVD